MKPRPMFLFLVSMTLLFALLGAGCRPQPAEPSPQPVSRASASPEPPSQASPWPEISPQAPQITVVVTPSASRIAPGMQEAVDLDVTYIARTPLYHPYCVEYRWDVPNQPGIPQLCSGTENDRRWPEPGEPVTFTAHVVNKGGLPSPSFEYTWTLDGSPAASGELPGLAPGAEATAELTWAWGHALSADGQQVLGAHTVGFIVDPDNTIAEAYESNNRLEDATQAMSLVVYFTPEMYAAYNIPVDPQYPFSAEDWLQKQIAAMNAMFAGAVYPVTPHGSALRVRIDQINVASSPPEAAGQDGSWFISSDVRCENCGYYDRTTDIDWGLLHELAHQVALIDLYAIGVYAPNVFVLDQHGRPASVGFGWSHPGLMGGGDTAPYNLPTVLSSHSAGGSNTLAGYRNGYYGAYLFDIPRENFLQILDNRGQPAAGVQVDLFQRAGPWDSTGHMGVDNTPEISGISGPDGVFALPNRSALGGTTTLNGHQMHDNPFGVVDIIGNQGLLLIRLRKGSHEEFHWLDITRFNLAFWMGDVDRYTFTIQSHVPPDGALEAPQISSLRVEGARAVLDWLPVAGAAGYRVYRAAAPVYEPAPVSDLLSNPHYEEEFWGDDGQSRVYAVTAIAPGGLESGFSELIYTPDLSNPVAVDVNTAGQQRVLNPGNMYPLLTLEADGFHWQRAINVHYDLWNTSFLTHDPAGRVILSGYGQFQNERAAVRIYDTGMQPLLAFGAEGDPASGISQPAGVAWWGPACNFAGQLYLGDADTLLLAHLDGNAAGQQGEMGLAPGARFSAGKFGQGILLDHATMLSFPAEGNLQAGRGAVEFWVQPAWNGDDGGNHTLFWWGEGDNFFHLRKDGASNLVFDYFYTGGSCGAPMNIAAWQAGEWHHLGFTWNDNLISLYVDGLWVAQQLCGGTAQPISSSFYVGSGPDGKNPLQAVIDELRVSSSPRVGIEEPCGRILLADSAASRILAFDPFGNQLGAYGSPGSEQEQFNTPQGVTVGPAGRVYVVDQGNNRVVALGFDGAQFSYLGELRAGFNAPVGIAVDPAGNLYVADTGNNRIVRLDPQGTLLDVLTAPNDGSPGNFNAPRGVAITRQGDLLVADTGSGRVVLVRGVSR